jgi:D-arabinose 1-dehydrogenase-like Zn-dependent alcohol dehydrogenase
LLGAMLLTLRGFRVFVYSRSRKPNEKAAVAEAVGAVYVSTQEKTPEELARLAGNINFVYEAAGGAGTGFELLRVLGADGVFVFTGMPAPAQVVGIRSNDLLVPLINHNQVVLGTVNAGPDAFARAVVDLRGFSDRWPAAVRSLITGRYPPEQFREPILKSPGIKNTITFAS